MQDLGFAGFRVGALGSRLGVSAQGIQDGPFGVFKNQSARARGICTMASGGGGGGGWGMGAAFMDQDSPTLLKGSLLRLSFPS